MAKKPISTSSPPYFSIFFLVRCFNPCTCFSPKQTSETNGMFVFGSSLVDNGNNHFLQSSTARADFMPYGIDFPSGPSGRFSNGKNVIDALGQLLKLPLIPVFLHPMTKGRNIINGVNYASGGSGILDETGSISGQVISLNQQIKNFDEVTVPDLCNQLNCNNKESQSLILSKYLFVMASGGNDYLLNYFLPTSITKPTLQAFTDTLTNTFTEQIMKLYSLGARKFVLISVYPLGCIPVVKQRLPVPEGCLDILNQAASLFNDQMKSLVDSLKPQMPGSNLVYVNSYQMTMDVLDNPSSQGFSDTSHACCEVPSVTEGGNGISCKRNGFACKDRKSHVFFDGLHPSEALNVLLANKAYSSSTPVDVYPVNVQQLAKL